MPKGRVRFANCRKIKVLLLTKYSENQKVYINFFNGWMVFSFLTSNQCSTSVYFMATIW